MYTTNKLTVGTGLFAVFERVRVQVQSLLVTLSVGCQHVVESEGLWDPPASVHETSTPQI